MIDTATKGMIIYFIMFGLTLIGVIYGYYLFITRNLIRNFGKWFGTFIPSIMIIFLTWNQQFNGMNLRFWGLNAAYFVQIAFAVMNIYQIEMEKNNKKGGDK